MKRGMMFLLVAVSMLLSSSTGLFVESALAGEYRALQGVKSIRTIFDFRDEDPESAPARLKLIQETFLDPALRSVSPKPEFVVVFMGPSVKLLSRNRDKFSADEAKLLEEFDTTLSALAKEGVGLEVCLVAARSFGVDPQSLAPAVTQVGNGWIASMGYQQQGYALVPVF